MDVENSSSAGASLRIQERFVSLQGEGELAGVPSSFIRISGCNLRCTWCDTPRTSWAPAGPRVAIAELVRECAAGPRHVVVTGGEPLLYPHTATLTQALARAGHHVTIETAGTVMCPGVHADLMSLSPKLAHSSPRARDAAWGLRHEARRWRPAVISALMRWPWQLKFVVRAYDVDALREDVAEIEGMLRELPEAGARRERVHLMPECVDPARLSADYEALAPICRATGFRLGPRLHIAIFGHTPGT